ncbi:MAG TPA: hypothetical protein VIC26_03710 [Marinagarivorans sp.]
MRIVLQSAVLVSLATIAGCGSSGSDSPSTTVSSVSQTSSQGASQSSASGCQNNSESVIFDDCFSSKWLPGIWDDAEKVTFIDGEQALPNTAFFELESEFNNRGKVIDIEYFQVTGFSSFQLYPSDESSQSDAAFTVRDLSAYADGYLSFDLRILDYGQSQLGLFASFQCGWPCRSRYYPVANISGVNDNGIGEYPLQITDDAWYSVKIPIADFTADNLSPTEPDLDLSMVNTIVIAPGWASETELQGFHMQLDNIRLELP